MENDRINLLGFTRKQLIAYCQNLNEKAFRATQLMRWIHQRGQNDVQAMSDLAKSFREKLVNQIDIRPPQILKVVRSVDGTTKWLLGLSDGNAIETVFIPEENRGTLCVSTQAGCAINCLFCATGKQGFSRNLTAAEIIGQLWLAEFELRRQKNNDVVTVERQISNVVLMGMGEPLLNLEAVCAALEIMLDDFAYGLSRRRVTVSTSGIVPQIDALAQQVPVALAVSLHAPDDDLRNELVPINRRYPIESLLKACQRYLKVAPRDFITFEYCLLANKNDSNEQAQALVQLLTKGALAVPCKINLIPFNAMTMPNLKRPSDERIASFAKILQASGIVTTVRRSRGEDIDAACGLLAGEIHDKTRRAIRLQEENIDIKNYQFQNNC